jgi:hypothetical protein
VDEEASVAAGAPPDYYSASVEVATVLDPARLRVSGQASASAGPLYPFPTYPDQLNGFAQAGADVTVLFELDEAAPIRIVPSPQYEVQYAALHFLDLAFTITWNYDGLYNAFCFPGEPLCDELLDAVSYTPDGGILPAGHYRFDFEFEAFEPGYFPCATGCHSAGGAMTLEIVPEPASAGLFAAGLALLAAGAHRHDHRPRQQRQGGRGQPPA